jgi:hypothetical protein
MTLKVAHINPKLDEEKAAVKELSMKLGRKWRDRDKQRAEQLYFLENRNQLNNPTTPKQ